MSDIKSGVVLVTKFVSAENQIFKGYIDYIDREQAVRNEKYTEYSIDTLQDELNKYGNYMDYMGNPQKTSELFTEDKDKLTPDEKDVLKHSFQVAQYNDSLMWQTVISFDNRWLAEQGLFDLKTHTVNEAKLKECARGAMSRIIESENLSNSAIWSGAIHYNTNHIHVHMAMVEVNPTREIIQEGEFAGQRKGKFKNATLEKAKSFIVNNILTDKENNQEINDLIRKNLVAAMQENGILQDKELRDLYLKIYNRLPANKRLWQYNRNVLNPVRSDLDTLITKWIEKYHKEDFEKLKKELQTQQAVYQTAYGTRKDQNKSTYAENKIKDLYSRLGNAILNNFKTLEITEEMDLIDTVISDSITENENLNDNIENLDFSENEVSIFNEPPLDLYLDRSKKYKKAKDCMYNAEPDFEKAFALLSVEAGCGNIYAIYDLAYLYSKGLGCEADFEKSHILYSLALDGFYKESLVIEPNTQKKASKLAYLNYRIAKMHYYGLGTEKDLNTAYDFFCFSNNATNGYPFAQYYIARFFEQGEVVEEDLNKAFSLYKSLADQTSNTRLKVSLPFAVYKTGQMCEQGKGTQEDSEQATFYYEKALQLFLSENSTRPDDQLQYRIGKMYQAGKGTEKDLAKATAFFKSSAKLGNDMANYSLAMIYLNDKNSPPELIEKAIEMLKRSADPDKSNNDLAQYQLGTIYLKQSDIANGEYYLTLSANQGNQFAQYKLGKFLIKSTDESRIKLGISYLHKSAEQGNSFAKYTLGSHLINNPNKSELDIFTALNLLQEASEDKNCFASYQLGKIYLVGEDVMQDCIKSEKYLLQALDNRDEDLKHFSNIEHLLGKLYFNGGVDFEIDTEKGLHYYTVAADKGNQYSQYALGSIYYYGINGVAQNIEKSRYYLSLSFEQGNERAAQLLTKINNPYQPQKKHSVSLPTYHNLNINVALSNLFRALGREYKNYENYINQQFYNEMQRETENETQTK